MVYADTYLILTMFFKKSQLWNAIEDLFSESSLLFTIQVCILEVLFSLAINLILDRFNYKSKVIVVD